MAWAPVWQARVTWGRGLKAALSPAMGHAGVKRRSSAQLVTGTWSTFRRHRGQTVRPALGVPWREASELLPLPVLLTQSKLTMGI